MTILTRKAGGKFYRSIGAVAARYGKHPKTIDRWMRSGMAAGERGNGPRVKFPEPDLVVNSVRHWLDATLDQFDAAQRNLARGHSRIDTGASTETV